MVPAVLLLAGLPASAAEVLAPLDPGSLGKRGETVSREAAAAHSLGRQPKDSKRGEIVSREAAAASSTRNNLLPPLRGYGVRSFEFLGLTPKATCCHHYVVVYAVS
jgi:hypothetical protein